jgi:hypothetical protein
MSLIENVAKAGASMFFAFAVVACGHVAIDTSNSEVTKGGIVVRPLKIKNKGDKYDVQLAITNTTQKNIIILLSDMSCYRGSTMGSLKHTFFNTGERTIDFTPGRSKSFNMVCDMGVKTKGPYRLSISKVYDNPKADGATRGAVIIENIDWIQKD